MKFVFIFLIVKKNIISSIINWFKEFLSKQCLKFWAFVQLDLRQYLGHKNVKSFSEGIHFWSVLYLAKPVKRKSALDSFR